MYTATVQLTINQFVPMSGTVAQSPTIAATIAPPLNTSPQPQTAVFSGDGQSITITVPKGYTGTVGLTYQLPDPRYALLGVAFQNPEGGSGRLEFPAVMINCDPTGSQLGVIDTCNPRFYGVDFDYVILVQEVSSGNIGLIDPDIDNKTTE